MFYSNGRLIDDGFAPECPGSGIWWSFLGHISVLLALIVLEHGSGSFIFF
jgi:hypothetical protein